MGTGRSTALQRRAEAIEAGMRVFADLGLTTAAVQRVADEIGVSQPYVFRLFGSKQAFFLACVDEVEGRIREAFRRAAAGATGDPLEAMGEGFRELVADGVVSGMWLQACALARGDGEVAARCRALLVGVLEEAGQLTRATSAELTQFLADGALVMLLQALGADLSGGSRAAVAALRGAEGEA